jgi:hypothetical protein
MNKSSMSNTATSSDGKIVDQAKQAVTHVASDVASQAKEQVNAQFDARKDKAVETIGNVATAIRETSDKLKGVGPLGDVAGRAADGIEKVADFFEGKQIGDVVRDVEGFARREPALFIGAAFALGLIGGRFLKSSSHRSGGGSASGRGIGGGMGGQYARSGRTSYDRYQSGYGASFGDDDYLSDADLQDDIDSQRVGAYGSSRVGRTTQPLGSSTGTGASAGATSRSQGSSMSGGSAYGSSAQGSSLATQSSALGATQGSPSATSSSSSTTKIASTPPAKNGLGGAGNTGSV